MTLEELHARVRAFVDARDWAQFHSPRNLAMALSVEAGELLEVYLWTADDAPPTPERTAKAADEAADVMICLLNLCDRAGIDLGQAVVSKLGRAAEKYPAEQVRGQALKYDQYPSWDGESHGTRHHLQEDPGDLPSAALRLLVDRGLPKLLSLPPDRELFRSALGSGSLRATTNGRVLGEAGSGTFVLRVPEGDVVFVDQGRVQTVDRSLPAFVEALETFHGQIVGLPAGADPSERLAVFDSLRAIDPTAFDDRDGYWTMWLEERVG